MTRRILLSIGWIATGIGLYVTLVGLEFYWNLYNWEPRSDWRAGVLVLAALVLVAVMGLLARASSDKFSRGVSLFICLALLALGIYVVPAEPSTTGLFAREVSSPVWHRGGRLFLLAMPGLFWVLGLRTVLEAAAGTRQQTFDIEGALGQFPGLVAGFARMVESV